MQILELGHIYGSFVIFFIRTSKYHKLKILQVRTLHTGAVQNAEARLKTFSVYRWNPDKPDEKPYMQKYKVDMNA